MQYSLTHKILSRHSNKKEISPGEFIEVEVSLSLANDITAPITIEKFLSLNTKLYNKDKIVLVLDHFVPNKDVASAEQCRLIREFAKKFKIKHFYENLGIEHVLLPEMKLISPGDVVIGADSHTCTYGALGCFSTGVGSTDLLQIWVEGKLWIRVPECVKVVFNGKLNRYVTGKDLILYLISKIGVEGGNYKSFEFYGNVIKKLKMNDRFTICNMIIECGGESAIMSPDEVTMEFVSKSFKFETVPDTAYSDIIEIDCSEISPVIALPHSPANVVPAEEARKVYVDQVFIGSCTNGWYEDMYRAASILKGRKVNPNTRLIVTPATQQIYKKMLKTGLLEIFLESGAVVTPPSCGPCLGGHLGILAKGEKCLATTNRNFRGRMGHPESEVYLCNPYIAAASAIKGRIATPDEIRA